MHIAHPNRTIKRPELGAKPWHRSGKAMAPEREGGRENGGSGRNRTVDTRIFSPLLYRLSYRATRAPEKQEVASYG